MPSSDVVSSADAVHLLRRAGFGGSPAEISALTGRTRAQAVAAVLGFADGDAAPLGPDVGSPGWVSNDADQWQVHSDIIHWWVDRMATLPNPTATPGPAPAVAGNLPIYERLAFFWHDHFACNQDKVFDIEAMWSQLNLFRRMAMGNFADLVRAVSTSPAMLVALDNQHNTLSHPQENFAREIMELYTCGVGNYTEADVVAMTRAWTGHNTYGWNNADQFWDSRYRYVPGEHDQGQKTLLGITANWNGIAQNGGERDTIDELVYGVVQDATANRIARLLFQHFGHLAPRQSTIDDLASVFGSAGMELGPLIRAVFEHDQFWETDTRWAQVKNPLDFAVSVVKQTGIAAENFELRWRMGNMGMVPLDPPSVAGWGRGSTWLNTASAWARGDFGEYLRWVSGMSEVFGDLAEQDRNAAIDEIFDYFGIDTPSAGTRARLLEWFDAAKADHPWAIAPQARMLGVLTPEFQVY
ncbi:MAG: DUF1800 domain-containing protein [Actinomycetota bacterium]